MRLPRDLREFIGLLNSERVEYAIAGGWALGFHGRPRYTQDIDILIRTTPASASRLEIAIERFGFGLVGLAAQDFLSSGQVIQLGHPPNWIDLLIGRGALITNKRATDRPRDRADVEDLGEN
jgi:hypothetical protein